MSSLSGEIVVRPAEAHGWLRRPELDTHSAKVWELPDGQLYAQYRGDPAPLLSTMTPLRFTP